MKSILKAYKHAPGDQISSYCIPILAHGAVRGRLRPITPESIHNQAEIAMLTEWRGASSVWFSTQFPATEDGTRQWLQHQVMEAEDRILFFVEDEERTPVGQIGFIHYDEERGECEFDNLLRGKKGKFGNIMIYALMALGEWTVRVLNLQRGYLNVLGDNVRAIHIYKRLGAEEQRRVALTRTTEGDIVRWVPAIEKLDGKAERELVTMMIAREAFMKKLPGLLYGKEEE